MRDVRWRDHLAAAANATPDARYPGTQIAHRYGILGRVPAAGRLGRAAELSTVAADLAVAICSPMVATVPGTYVVFDDDSRI